MPCLLLLLLLRCRLRCVVCPRRPCSRKVKDEVAVVASRCASKPGVLQAYRGEEREREVSDFDLTRHPGILCHTQSGSSCSISFVPFLFYTPSGGEEGGGRWSRLPLPAALLRPLSLCLTLASPRRECVVSRQWQVGLLEISSQVTATTEIFNCLRRSTTRHSATFSRLRWSACWTTSRTNWIVVPSRFFFFFFFFTFACPAVKLRLHCIARWSAAVQVPWKHRG